MNNTPLNGNEYKPFPSIKQAWIMVAIILMSSVSFAPISGIAGLLPFKFFKEFSFFLVYLLSFGGASVVIYLYKRNKEKEHYKHPNFKINDYLLIPLVIAAVIALQMGVTIPLISFIPIPEFIAKIMENLSKDMQNIWGLTAIIILAPILEEYLFRGVMLDGLLKRISPIKAILISSALFGLVHLNPWQFISAMMIGIFAGWIYYKTRSLSLAIIIHFANNGWAMLWAHLNNKTGVENEMPQLHYVVLTIIMAIVFIYILNRRLTPSSIEDSSLKQLE